MLVLPLKLTLSVAAARLMSTALPVCVPPVFQLLLVTTRFKVPVVPALRSTSIPSAPAPRNSLLLMVNVPEPASAAAVVSEMALHGVPAAAHEPPPAVVPPAKLRPTISMGICVVTLTVSPLALVTCGLVPAGTRRVGEPLPLRFTGIESATPSPIKC